MGAAMRYQPQGLARLNPANPITRGLTAARVPSSFLAKSIGSATTRAGPTGTGYISTSTSSYWQASPTSLVSVYPTWTILTLIDGPLSGSVSNGQPVFTERPNGTQIVKVDIGRSAGGVAGLVIRDSTNTLQFVNGTSNLSTMPGMRVIVATRRASNDHRIFVNGRQEGAGVTNIAGSFADTAATIGVDLQDSSVILQGATPLVACWSRALSDAEIAQISANPWQLFDDPSRSQSVAANTAALAKSYSLTAGVGAFSIAGSAAALRAQRVAVAAPGSFSLAGMAANLRANRRMAATGGAFALSGIAANLVAARKLGAAQGSFAIASTPALLRATRRLSASPGSFVLTPGAISLVYTPKPAPSGVTYTLSAASVSFGLAGAAAALRANRQLAISSGTFLLGGAPTGLILRRTLRTDATGFSLTGQPALIRSVRRLSVQGGQFGLTGLDAQLSYSAQIDYARAPSGSGYAPHSHYNETRPVATSSPRPAAMQRNTR